MSQQIINLGSGPDTQTGDTVSVAFTKVNNNFTELYSVFDGNGITTINANVIFANNIVTTTNVRAGNLFAYGNIESIGYVITAGAFYPNGVPIGSIDSINSNLIPTLSNVYTLGNSDYQFSQAYIGSNLTLAGANVTVRNGQIFVNGQIASGNYGNANVAQYLPVYGGNIAATVTTANQRYITSVGILTGLNVVGNTSISGNLDVSGTITYLNVRDFSVQDPIITLNTGPNGAPLISNNSFDSGVRTYYYDGQNKASFFGRTSSTGYFEYYSNVISETGNIITGTYGTIKSANLILTSAANIAGNVTGNYFLGNGRFLDGIDATSIQNGNSNVKVYANGNVSVTTAGTNTWNFGTAGQLTVPGPISGLGSSKLDFTTYGPATAYLTTTNDDSTALFMGLVSAELYANTYVSIRANTGGTSQTWTFNEDGTLTLPGNLITSSNVIANYFLGNFVGNISGNISAAGTNTQVLFNDNNITNATSGLTFNKSSNLLTIGGTVSALDVNVAGFNVIDSNGNIVTSRLQNSGVTSGIYGNASSVPSITVDSKGRVTAISNVAVAGVSNVSYDTITGNLTVSTSSGTNYVVDLGVGTSDAPVFANLSISGNTIVNALTINNSATIGSTLGVTGNLIAANINTSGTANVGQVVVAGYTVIDTTGNVVSSRLENTGVVAGTYGNASSVPSITVDEKGRITGVSNTAVAGVSNLTYNQNTSNLAIVTSAGTAFYVDLNVGIDDSPTFANATLNQFLTVLNTANVGQLNVNGITVVDTSSEVITSRLKNSGVTPGIYGNANAVPVFSVDEKGRVLGVSNVAIGGISNISYDTTTGNISITTSDGTSRGIDIGVGTADSPIFAGLSIYGNATANALTVNNSVTIGSTLGVTGNINGNGITLTGSLVARGAGDFDGGLQSTPIGNASASTGQFTTVSATGNITGAALTSNGSITASTTLSAAGGIQNTPIGNVTPSTAIFTGVSVSGNSTVNALTVNTSATVGTTLGVTGNINGNGVTLTGSLVARGAGDFDGGLQSTPIGNATASTGQFTTVSATGNITGAALTSNGSITSGITLSVASNITVGTGSGGNITGANFISANSFVAAVSFNGPLNGNLGSAGGNSAIVSTLSATGNATVNALTVNNSTTIGSTLGVTGNIVGANIRTVNGVFASVESATVGNTGTSYTGSTYTATGSFNGPLNGTLGSAGGNSAIVSTLSGTGAAALNSLQVNNAATVGTTLTVGGLATLNSFYANTDSIVGANLTVVGNLVVSGNVIASGSNNTYFTDSIIELHTLPNLANLTFDDGKDIGIRFHYYKTQNDNAFLGWQNSTGHLEWIGSGATEDVNANIITGSYGTFKTGELVLANATPSTGTSTGALQVNGGASFSGNVYANGVAYFGNATAITLTNPLIVATTTANTYTQIQIQNQSTGGAASSDFIATADDGTDTTKYIDMGINGSGWDQSTWTVSGPRDGYLYTSGVNLTIGTDTVGKTLKIHTGGLLAACVVATFNDVGTVSSSSNTGALVLTGGLGVSGAINGGSTLSLVGNATVTDLTVNNTATFGSTLGVTGNINGSSLTLTGSEVATGSIQALGGLQATPIGNASTSTGQFTTVSATGNITGASLTSNGSITAVTTLNAAGGIQNTPIGNVTPSTALFTTVGTSGNLTVSALTVNGTATVGTTLGVTGNINGNGVTLTGSLVASGSGDFDGGLQNTPIGNVSASTGQFTTVSATGNITGASLTSNGSITAVTTISSLGGLQATPIGNVTPSTALFTTAGTSGNATLSALSVNGTATIGSTLGVTGNINGSSLTLTGSEVATGSIQALGGLQDTPIGNASASTGQFTTVSATGNITAAALTSNASITAITSMSALGGLQATPIGNVSPSTALFTTVGTSGNSTVNALTVNASATIGTNLSVTDTVTAAYFAGDGGRLTNVGNITVANTSISNYYPVTFANVGTGPLNALNGGMRYNPSLGALAGLNTATIGTSITTSSLIAASLGVNLFNATATTINLGGAATVINVGASNVVATFGSGTGNIVAGNITGVHYGNSFGTTATYSGNTTVNALTINNSATIGTTLGVTGNATVGNILAGGFFFANGTPLTTSAGGTSGEVQFNNGGAFAGATGFTVSGSNVSIANLTINSSATIGTTLGVTGNVTAGNITTAGLIRATATTSATSNVTGAVQILGGVGIAGNVYVGQRVGWVAANSVSVVYQVYNAATNSLDTVFE
jgi:hypothetical protein